MTKRTCPVLIPGELCDARLFARQAQGLRAGCRFIMLDYRQLRDIEEWSQCVLRDLPERFALAGVSLGGLLALDLVRRAPERVQRLALIASNGEGGGRRAEQRSAGLWRQWRYAGPCAVTRHVKPGYFAT